MHDTMPGQRDALLDEMVGALKLAAAVLDELAVRDDMIEDRAAYRRVHAALAKAREAGLA